MKHLGVCSVRKKKVDATNNVESEGLKKMAGDSPGNGD